MSRQHGRIFLLSEVDGTGDLRASQKVSGLASRDRNPMPRILRPDPQVRISDYSLSAPSWQELDRYAAEKIGVDGVVIPSVRVGLLWTLEYMGLKRHSDHVMVPRFMGRCILNSMNRAALPVEQPTPQTRVVVVLHQFGFRQNLEAVRAECASRKLPYVEDSPFGFEHEESPGPGSMAKFLGFAKILPAIKGGLGISSDPGLVEYIRKKRERSSLWSWPLTIMMAILRAGKRSHLSSVMGELAYELYPSSPSDNFFLRGNLAQALTCFDSFEAIVGQRLRLLASALGAHASIPDTTRLASFVPFRVEGRMAELADVVQEHGFDSTLYHFDFARNIFSPRYEQVLLIPVNPRISDRIFNALVSDLQQLLVRMNGRAA